ncbi:MAG: glycosyltransferase family 1 protein [Rickettsiaceae bacterium]|jgi:glycosyltransferase involved in cell wall biosynthesis|nr:glycosyltransferase family 1 protein [Rickettsiaceae bacterium]
MHIINVMFSRGLGGIEQSFVDYCEAIKAQGNKVTAIIHPKAAIRQQLVPLGINIVNVGNIGHWDFFAKSYIKKILKQANPDAVIAHGNRAIRLLSPAKKLRIPLISVTHNYNIQYLIGLDAVFATTQDLHKKVLAAGQNENVIYDIPNMIRLRETKTIKPFGNPVVIGTMGRFVKKKGFDIFILAIAELKQKNILVKAIIGGGGEEESALRNLCNQLNLNDVVEFRGWVSDKAEFFENIDIFCLPSLHEPFGIILLEAFMYGKPVVTSDSEGPSEIVTNQKDALVVAKGDAVAMAEAVIKLIGNEKPVDELSAAALQTVKNYDINTVGAKIDNALKQLITTSQR